MLRAGTPFFRLAVCCLALILLGAMQAQGADELRVAVSIPPQKHILSRIGGDRVTVEVLLPPGANPTTYEPKPSQLINISKVSAFFTIGLPVESVWLKRLRGVNADLRIVTMYRGIERRPMAETYEEALQSGAEWNGGRNQGHPDPHIWLAPPLVRIMAQTVRDELIRLDPEHASLYRAKFTEFAESINELDRELLELFSDTKTRSFLAFHPAWGYFASAYGLKQVPVMLGAKNLTAKRMHRLIRIARKKDLRTVFYQPQFSSRPARQIAQNLNGSARELDPLAKDWEANLRESARSIRRALE
jgi:zinc transport system substrate-binding protein